MSYVYQLFSIVLHFQTELQVFQAGVELAILLSQLAEYLVHFIFLIDTIVLLLFELMWSRYRKIVLFLDDNLISSCYLQSKIELLDVLL